ncbi:MAG TPA: hypothetical protein VGG32_01810 [Thermoplasmata archaeon]|jgi:hypothetical protein
MAVESQVAIGRETYRTARLAAVDRPGAPLAEVVTLMGLFALHSL